MQREWRSCSWKTAAEHLNIVICINSNNNNRTKGANEKGMEFNLIKAVLCQRLKACRARRHTNTRTHSHTACFQYRRRVLPTCFPIRFAPVANQFFIVLWDDLRFYFLFCIRKHNECERWIGMQRHCIAALFYHRMVFASWAFTNLIRVIFIWIFRSVSADDNALCVIYALKRNSNIALWNRDGASFSIGTVDSIWICIDSVECDWPFHWLHSFVVVWMRVLFCIHVWIEY